MTSTNRHEGGAFDDFLREDGIYEEVSSIALARVLAWQLKERMEQLGISKVEMAARMGTSRSQLDRLLEASTTGVTLDTMVRAARAVDRTLTIELL